MVALYTQLLDKQSDRDFYFGWTTMRILFPITVTQIEFPDGVKGIRVTCSELVFEIKFILPSTSKSRTREFDIYLNNHFT